MAELIGGKGFAPAPARVHAAPGSDAKAPRPRLPPRPARSPRAKGDPAPASPIAAHPRRRDRRAGSPTHHTPPRQRPSLDPDAKKIDWDACTVRGWADGSLVFKFDQLDPSYEEEAALHATPRDAALANFAWSNSLKLGVKFPQQLAMSIRKLEHYVAQFDGDEKNLGVDLKYGLFKTYEKAARQQERLRQGLSGSEDGDSGDSGEETGSEASGSNGGAGSAVDEDADDNGVRRRHYSKEKEKERERSGSAESNGTGPRHEPSLAEMVAAATEGAVVREHVAPATAEEPVTAATPPARPWAILLAAAAARTAAVSLLMWLLRIPLTLYRLLPYALRRLFHFGATWPPTLSEPHVSPAVAGMHLSDDGFSRTALSTAGFDPQGRSSGPTLPLSDVPAWRLEQLVGAGVRNAELYRQALIHPTALQTEQRHLSYERLEYLGDAVLELCTRQLLMERAPDADEGTLTNRGQALVAGATVNRIGAWMCLDRWVCCNAYSMRDSLAASSGILGDAFEALLGAVYVDKGLGAARRLLLRVLKECPALEWDAVEGRRDYKGLLMRSMSAGRKGPSMKVTYSVISSRMLPFHGTAMRRKFWVVAAEVGGAERGRGGSFDKREAEQAAAREALEALGELPSGEEEESEGEEHP
jgi:ribonuclease-3